MAKLDYTRPFHQTIVELMTRIDLDSDRAILTHSFLLRNTRISANHDKVIAAIEQRWGNKQWCQNEVLGMKASVEIQRAVPEISESQIDPATQSGLDSLQQKLESGSWERVDDK